MIFSETEVELNIIYLGMIEPYINPNVLVFFAVNFNGSKNDFNYMTNYIPALWRGYLFYLCPSVLPSVRPSVLPSVRRSVRPSVQSRTFFVAFYSATIHDRNLIFGHKLQKGIPYRVSVRFLLPVFRLG